MHDRSAFATTRRDLLAVAALAGVLPAAVVGGMTGVVGSRPAGAAGFDFLHGRWRVRHRKLTRRLVGATDWIEFDGTLDVKPFLGGLGNIDENVLDDPGGRFLATSIRVFHAKTGTWSIHWVDARRAGLDKPVIGTFEGKLGRFYNDDSLDGRPIRVRFTYEDLTATTARWDQAFSADGGRSWETNWHMAFSREDQA